MSDELREAYFELELTLDTLRQQLARVENAAPAEKQQEMYKAEQQLQSVHQVYDMCKMEYDGLTSRQAWAEWSEKMLNAKKMVESFEVELASAKGATSSSPEVIMPGAGIVTDEQKMRAVLDIGADDISALDRMIRDTDEANKMADDAQQKLIEDEQRIMSIQEDVSQMHNDMNVARRQLTTISRRIAGDRVFQILAIILILLAIALIVYKSLVK